MDASLLATKTSIPPPTERMVSRARLLDALNRGALAHKLTLISAPAGYGKTTLLRQWSHAAPAPVAWFSIDEADNDRVRFLRYLVAAWEPVWPEVAESPAGLMLGAANPDPDAVLAACINLGGARRSSVIVVLDDYHVITDPTIHRSMTFLLDHLPPLVHFVIAGRDEPPLPLARYRARQELLELRASDLRFRIDEATAFLRERVGHDLSPDTIASLTDQLEGWIAGLHLLSLRRSHAQAADGPLRVTGQHRFIADYLREEVLAHLSDDRRRFMLQTSILDQMSGALCDAVTGATGGQATLDALERANLFVEPLDDEGEWFRYHRLFAEVLRGELGRTAPQRVQALQCRAARWYLARGMAGQALRHAVAGADIDTARAIFDRFATEQINCGGMRVVQGWLDTLPPSWLKGDVSFGLARAGCLMAAGAFAQGVRCIDDVEAQLTATAGYERSEQYARIQAVRCFVACAQNDLAGAVSLAGRALQSLPGDDLSYRVGVHLALGDSYRRNGLWEEARAAYLGVLDLEHGRPPAIRAMHAFGALADLELRRGCLKEAGRFWRQALTVMQGKEVWGRLPLDVSGWVFLRYAELLYEWDDLDDARDYLDRGLVRAELGGHAVSVIAGHLIAARVRLTEGDVAGAGTHLDLARPLVAQSSFPDWASRFDRCQIELWLGENRLQRAVDWANAMCERDAFAQRPENEAARLALARVFILRGDERSRIRAGSLLDRLLIASETEGRASVRIEALALQALAHWQHGETAAALSILERSLRLAEPEGYIRRYADLGLPMARLLQEARARHVLPDYLARLLAAFHDASAAPGSPLPEPLSDRERDVLQLVASGLTNREIADTLFISRETVKKHTGAIFGKLGVSNRTEAAARARVLGLLAD